MRFLHTSDWHLGRTDTERSLQEDQQYFIDQICNIIKEKQIDAVLLAGDVYDRAVASAEAIRLYDGAMRRICLELGKPVLMIAGNHDGADRLASCSALLEGAGLHIRGALTRDVSPVVFDDAEVFLLPWITEEKVKSVFAEEKDNVGSLDDAYRIVTAAMRERFTPGKKHIAVAHAFITNAETSLSDRSAEIGFAAQVSAGAFEGFDYVALGHIHKPQNVNDTVRYCGTPMPYAFGKEETQEKSVTILDTADMTKEIVPLKLLHRRATLCGTLKELEAADVPPEVRTGYVRLDCTDSFLGLEAQAALRAVYPNCMDISYRMFSNENTSVTMSAAEFHTLETDPSAIFSHFCRSVNEHPPEEHLLELFRQAVAETEEEEAGV